jgi:putative drug exporter of the RND superfamily
MGFALGIDYTLLIISRFRDELAGGADRDEALVRTMATAGRTVAFSAITVALSMVAMALFPMYFLKSFAYAGVAVVAFGAIAAIAVTPAAIVLIGDRLDALDIRRLGRRLLGRPEPVPRPIQKWFWYRSTKFVMRFAIPVALTVIVFLLILGAPFLGIKWGFPDDRVLPPSASARQVGDELRHDFAVDAATNVVIVIPDTTGVTPTELDRYAAQLSQVVGVTSVSSPGGTFVAGAPVGPPSAATGLTDNSAFLTVGSSAPLFSKASETQLDRLHAIVGPSGRDGLFTSTAQVNRDSSQAVTSRLPAVLGVIAAITCVLLFLLTGSVRVAAQGVTAQRVVVDRRFRRPGVDLPGRTPGRVRYDTDGHPRRQHASVVVLHRFWIVDGLRGVSGLADPRILAGIEQDASRQRRERCPGPGSHRPGRDRRGAFDVDFVRGVDHRPGVFHADVRCRADARGAGRRNAGAHAASPGVHARARTG